VYLAKRAICACPTFLSSSKDQRIWVVCPQLPVLPREPMTPLEQMLNRAASKVPHPLLHESRCLLELFKHLYKCGLEHTSTICLICSQKRKVSTSCLVNHFGLLEFFVGESKITNASYNFATKIFDKLHVNFANIHFRIEESNYQTHIKCGIGHEMLVTGVCVPLMCLRAPTYAEVSANPQVYCVPRPAGQDTSTINKHLEISGLSVYCKRDTHVYGGKHTHSYIFQDGINDGSQSSEVINTVVVRDLFMDVMKCANMHVNDADDETSTHSPFILHPLTLTAEFQLCFANHSLYFGPIRLHVSVSHMHVTINDEQLVYLYQVIKACTDEMYYLQSTARWINCSDINTTGSNGLRAGAASKSASEQARAQLCPVRSRRARLRWHAIRDFIRVDFWFKYASSSTHANANSANTQSSNHGINPAAHANTHTYPLVNGAIRWRCWFAVWRLCARYVCIRDILLYHVSYETVRDPRDGSVDSYSIVESLNMDQYANRHHLKGG
jgi:hypothetical protein